MYITARMVTIQWEDEDSYKDTVFATRLNASSISIVCLVSLTVIVRIMKHCGISCCMVAIEVSSLVSISFH